jgi:hypothetical protein
VRKEKERRERGVEVDVTPRLEEQKQENGDFSVNRRKRKWVK